MADTGHAVGELTPVNDESSVVAVAVGRFEGRDLIAIAGEDEGVATCDAVTREGVLKLGCHGSAVSLGEYGVMVGEQGGEISVWHPVEGHHLGSPFHGHRAEVAALCVGGPGGAILASGDAEGEVRVWDIATREAVASSNRTGTGVFQSRG